MSTAPTTVEKYLAALPEDPSSAIQPSRTLTALVLLGTLFALPATAQDEYGCDRSAIWWTLPGHFKEALARAKKENRLIIIKGIAFGVDEAGAKCATKGEW